MPLASSTAPGPKLIPFTVATVFFIAAAQSAGGAAKQSWTALAADGVGEGGDEEVGDVVAAVLRGVQAPASTAMRAKTTGSLPIYGNNGPLYVRLRQCTVQQHSCADAWSVHWRNRTYRGPLFP